MLIMEKFNSIKELIHSLFDKKKWTNAKSGYTYTPPGRPLQKSGNGSCVVVSGVLFIVALLWLSFFSPFSWQALISGMTRLPAGISKAIDQDGLEDTLSAEQQDRPLLRGTIYDRNMEEMSVSYRLFSLLVEPAELPNSRNEIAKRLALILDTEQEDILQKLQPVDGIVELADDLKIEQVEEIEGLHLPGIHCRPVEIRYYPNHAVAGQMLGFVSGNAGLSGVEALYDTVLEPGEFWPVNIPAVDFSGHDALGKTVADIVLTIDLELQRQLDAILEEYRRKKGAGSGSAIALDPDSGRILALVSQPEFDPNYFWQADEQEAHKALFASRYHRRLIRPLLVQAAAVLEAGMNRTVLPVTVSVPDYGLSEEVLQKDWLKLALGRAVPDFLPLSAGRTASPGDVNRLGLLSPVQMVCGLATLLNGGHRVDPWFLHALYDHTEKRFFLREKTASSRERLLSPIQGIQLRQKLLGDAAFSGERGFLFADTLSTVSERNGLSAHHIQDILVAAVPGERPEILLLLTADYDRLAPYPPKAENRDRDELFRLGRNLLPVLIGYGGPMENFAEPSPEKNPANLRRYFFSRKLNTAQIQENLVHAEQVMPSLIGLSLRKGLQQINKYNINVRIQGSGRIVEQKPVAGEALSETETCELILETEYE